MADTADRMVRASECLQGPPRWTLSGQVQTNVVARYHVLGSHALCTRYTPSSAVSTMSLTNSTTIARPRRPRSRPSASSCATTSPMWARLPARRLTGVAVVGCAGMVLTLPSPSALGRCQPLEGFACAVGLPYRHAQCITLYVCCQAILSDLQDYESDAA